MYRRYTNVNREGAPLNQINQIRIRNVIIVVLLAAVVVLTIRTVSEARKQGDERGLYISEINSEYMLAMDKMNKSHGDNAQELDEIRSNLYAIKKLNDVYLRKEKQILIPDEIIGGCINIVDEYFKNDAKGGTNLKTLLSNLRSAMAQLQETISGLE